MSAEGVGCKEGMFRFPLGVGSGKGLCPSIPKTLHCTF